MRAGLTCAFAILRNPGPAPLCGGLADCGLPLLTSRRTVCPFRRAIRSRYRPRCSSDTHLHWRLTIPSFWRVLAAFHPFNEAAASCLIRTVDPSGTPRAIKLFLLCHHRSWKGFSRRS